MAVSGQGQPGAEQGGMWVEPAPWQAGGRGRSLQRRSSGGEDSTLRTHPLYSFIFRGGQVPPSTGLTCTPTLQRSRLGYI